MELKKMKKNIALSIILASSFNLAASEYVLTLDKKHYDNYIDIQTVTETTEDAGLTCDLPLVLNATDDACIDSFDALDWIDRTDSCQGVRQTSRNPNVYIIRANTNVRNDNPVIPEGYKWLTSNEYESYMNSGVSTHNYLYHCGHTTNYPYLFGQPQYEISFSDSSSSARTTHSGGSEGQVITNSWRFPINWFGIAVYKEF
jgi:hypothetical protein